MAFKVEYFTLSGYDATVFRGVQLSGAPIGFHGAYDKVALDIISGTSQFDRITFTDATSSLIKPDFKVDGTTLKWDTPSYTLYWDGTAGLAYGDKIRVIYDRS